MNTLHERGAALTTHYEGAECSASSQPPDVDFFAVGPELPASMFPAIDETLFGAGRVRVMAYAKAGVELGTSSFYDTKTTSPCVPAPFADKKLRCVPHVARHNVLKDRFKDPSCLQPIYLESLCDRVTMLVDGNPGCGGAGFDVNVLPLGVPFELTTYYVKSAATCDPIANDGLASRTTFSARTSERTSRRGRAGPRVTASALTPGSSTLRIVHSSPVSKFRSGDASSRSTLAWKG